MRLVQRTKSPLPRAFRGLSRQDDLAGQRRVRFANLQSIQGLPDTYLKISRMPQRKDVFISYSRQDTIWKDRLYPHLRPLERICDAKIWDDTLIAPGEQWQNEIAKALASTKVAVLLLSANFLSSDFIANNELPPLLRAAEEEGTIILPLIVKPCGFKRTNLRQFQAVNDPDKSLIKLSEGEQEEVLDALASRIGDLLARADDKKNGDQSGEGSGESQSSPNLTSQGSGLPFSPEETREPLNKQIVRSGLNPAYTFASFVASKSNEFALAAAQRVAENPSLSFNPLYLYGGVGLGKTHLLHAIGHEIQRSRPHLRVLYLVAEQFAHEFVYSARLDHMSAFRERYRTIDVLMIDDVQFITLEGSVQEEFYHTFNTLYTSQKQIILASDCSPRNIPELEERLRSRFESGLIADIQPPDLETRIAILQRMASVEGIRLPEEVAEFIAQQFANIRELGGLLTRVIAFASLTGKPLSPKLARETLEEILSERRRKPNPFEIIKFVARYYDIKVTDIKSRSNDRRLTFPRQVAIYLCKRLTELSDAEIGHYFSDRHYSTVIYTVEAVQKKRDSDPEFDRTLQSLEQHFA